MSQSVVIAPLPEWGTAYADFWQQLSPSTLGLIDAHMSEGIHFVDPFVSLTGRPAVREHFVRVYQKLIGVTVTVHDVAYGQKAAYLRWTFAYRLKIEGPPWALEGVSEVVFGPDGRALTHIDHWDAGSQVYAKLPVLGPVIRWVASKV